MLCASTGNSASADLAAIGDVLAKKVEILVIDIGDLVTAERTWLLLELLHCRGRHLGDLWLWLKRLVISCAHCGAPF